MASPTLNTTKSTVFLGNGYMLSVLMPEAYCLNWMIIVVSKRKAAVIGVTLDDSVDDSEVGLP